MRIPGRPTQQPARQRLRPQDTAVRRTDTFSYHAKRTLEQPGTANRSLQRPRKVGFQIPALGQRKIGAVPFMLLAAVAVVCIGKVLYLNNNPKVIIVGGTATAINYLQPNTVYAKAAQRALSGSIANHIKLTADGSGTADAILQGFPELQAASVTARLIGNRPIIYISPLQPAMILQTSSGDYALNHDGVAFPVAGSSHADVPTVQDDTGNAPHAGTQALPRSTVAFIETVAYQLRAHKRPIVKLTLPGTSVYELDAQLAGNYSVKFNLQTDALQQSGALEATLKKLGQQPPKQYIDVRVPERVYYQ